MGKTRLAHELAAEAAARGVRVVWVEADEAERPALGLCDRIVRTVGSDAATDPTLPPSDRRWEVLEALVDGLREAAPILVVLDDLH
jgi:ATP/maltotriose-dependent transcriptional regulator MalT